MIVANNFMTRHFDNFEKCAPGIQSTARGWYDSLFKSHLSYCISSWGGVPANRLSKLFALQKRCIRLLFGIKLTHDHCDFFNTCARARTYSDHVAIKNFSLENTKPIFNKEKIMSIFNLYAQHTLNYSKS